MSTHDRNVPGGAALAPLPAQYAFVVQFGREADPAQGRFVGQVEHLASGRQWRFSNQQEMFAFLQRTLEQSMAAPAHASDENAERNK